MVYGLYFSNHLDLLGDVLKHCTPNLKKKKDEAIDKFKDQIIKAIKQLLESQSAFFAELSQFFSEKQSVELVGPEDLATTVEFFKSMTEVDRDQDAKKITEFFEKKRVAQMNKEYKASVARFKDTTASFSKRFANLKQQNKGFNP